MKIEKDNQLHLLDNLSKSASVKSTAGATKTTKQAVIDTQDKVELSSMKEEVNRLKEKVKAMPAVRPEKVAEMQEVLKNETYNPKGELVARKILQSHLLDEIF
jgi:flagellar biosynthesis anti-sigma factor FlgM